MADRRPTAQEIWGREFALARGATGLSQEAFAKQLFLSQSLVAMWETGRRVPKHPDLVRCEELFGTNGYLSRMLDLLVSREVDHEWMDRWVSVEQRATTLLSFQPTVIPGLLQTKEYARAVQDNDDYVAERLERQRVLDSEVPPMLVVLLPEYVLHHRVGDERVMPEQLTHLATMARRPRIAVQIVPLDSPCYAKFAGPFVVAAFDGGREVAYVDNQLRGEVVERAEDVAFLREQFDYFRADALPNRQSIELIERIASQWHP
ncbi:Scr1 family TA system antitoxin-like transcriptional regulator [Amycolatopsis sp. NPDC059027]|uniref:helix-turn-helix domain-containing protein n=1 Tax=unclassified Amycolatopsis TaxID=2618356 RepID=UPI00366B191C